MPGFFRFIAFLLLLGLIATVGVSVYNAGVSAGIASDVGNAVASGAPIPAGYYYGPYVGQPWGHGFGFGGFLIGLFFLFLFFGLLRAVFGGGRRWDHHRDGGSSKFGRHGGWQEYMGSWHDEQHGKAPDAPAVDKP